MRRETPLYLLPIVYEPPNRGIFWVRRYAPALSRTSPVDPTPQQGAIKSPYPQRQAKSLEICCLAWDEPTQAFRFAKLATLPCRCILTGIGNRVAQRLPAIEGRMSGIEQATNRRRIRGVGLDCWRFWRRSRRKDCSRKHFCQGTVRFAGLSEARSLLPCG
jgi:hypothetical protein